MTVIPIVIGVLGTTPKGLERRQQEVGIGWMNSIVEIGQNTEKNPGDLSSFRHQ